MQKFVQRGGLSIEVQHKMGIAQSAGVAYLAGCMNVLITNPIWVIATRMQCHRNGDKSIWKAVQQAYQLNGYQWALKV